MRKAESNHSVAGKSIRVLEKAAAQLGIPLDSARLELFGRYEEEILFWNRKINLISIKSPLDIPVKHFADSLTLAEFVPSGARLLDIGTGAGFPGVPLKILEPSLGLTLVESNGRKASFLRELTRKLGLKAEILNCRVEELGEAYRAAFDIVTSRAGLRLPELLEKGAFFLAPQGKILAMKGGSSHEEEELPEGLSDSLGLKLSGARSLRLPVTGDGRKILIYSKA